MFNVIPFRAARNLMNTSMDDMLSDRFFRNFFDMSDMVGTAGFRTIAADINSEKKDNREGYLYSERRTGHVERRFSLEGVREDDITAKCEHGILTVTLPKMQAEAPKAARKIAIASGEEKTDAPAEENK